MRIPWIGSGGLNFFYKSNCQHLDYLFRDLLDKICKRFPAKNSSQDSSQDGILVSCTWGSQDSSAVSVSTDGFLILEAAEDAMGSTEQNLEMVVVDNLVGALLSAVGSRSSTEES